MSVITLTKNTPGQLVSASSFDVLIGEPNRRLIIFSGIACPEIHVNDDENVYQDEVLVKLGVTVSVVHTSVIQVGLASISNGESTFAVAVDTGKLEIDLATSELQLRVNTGVLGEKTALSRFSYQIVTDVSKVAARITGQIRVPRNILDVAKYSQPELNSIFRISANRVEQVIPDPGGSPSFAFEKIIPVAAGSPGHIKSNKEDVFVEYTIDGCPFNIPLRVLVDTGGLLSAKAAFCGQVAGSRPVVLTNVEPEASGVDFLVSISNIR